MGKFLNITIYLNLVIAILSTIMAIKVWDTDRERAYIFIFLAVITGFMFFFRRHYLKKHQQQKDQQSQN